MFCFHGSTLVLACCKANHWSHGKKSKFCTAAKCPPFNRFQPKFAQLLSKLDQQLCQIWWKSHPWGLRYTGVKYNTCVCFYSNFSFPFLSFPFHFYSCHRLQPKRLNRFPWLMAQNAWIGARKCLLMSDQFWEVVSPKSYPKKASDAEIPAKWINSKITSKRFKIDTNCHCNMNITLRSPFQSPWWKNTYGAP